MSTPRLANANSRATMIARCGTKTVCGSSPERTVRRTRRQKRKVPMKVPSVI
jgi:hypothetical protein